MMSDLIADMLIRIQNAYASRKDEAEVPYSKINENIIKTMIKERFLKDFEISKTNKHLIKVNLLYINKKPMFNKIKRISKPGLRVYVNRTNLLDYIHGIVTVIISTSKGIMTVKEARKQGLGGEVICEIK